MTKKNIRF